MSYQPLWLRDLVAYSIQAAVIVGVGVVMARVLRLRMARVRHFYWQALLAVCVFLPLLQPWRAEVLESSGSTLVNVNMKLAAASAPAGPPVAEIVFWLISAGIVLRIVWMVLGLGRLWLYRRNAQRLGQPPEAVVEAQRLAPASASFFISHQLPMPATFGFFRPAILFPARFLEMESAMQRAIALHELLHVERRDWLWNMFEEIVLTLLWFHLPLWWVVRSARLSREQVVDAEAVRRSNARRPYLKALLEMAGQKQLAESLPAPLFLRESQLAERIALMMKEAHMSRTRLTFSILSAGVTLLIAGATLVWAFPLKTSSLQTKTPVVTSTPLQAEAGDTSGAALPENAVQGESDPAHRLGKVYKVGKKVSAPEPIYKPEPPYTPEAKRAHLSGPVVLWAIIDAKGRVVEANEQSKPLGKGLDESALNTVRTWKFKPGLRNGSPVPVKVMVEVYFRYYDGKKPDPASQNPDPAPDPQPQDSPNASADTSGKNNVYINQGEIQRRLDEAMKQAKIAQEAASKFDQAEIQQQVEQSMKQLKQMETPEMRQRVQEQMKQLEKMNTPEMHREYEEAMRRLRKMNAPEMRRGYEEALKQLKMAQTAAPKIDEAKLRQQVEQAMEQAKISYADAAKVNKAEIQRQLDQMRKQMEQSRKESEAARKEADKAQKDMMEVRRKAEAQPNAAKPEPAAAPKPPPVPPKEVKPPLAPPVPPSSEMVTPSPPSPVSPAPPPAPQN